MAKKKSVLRRAADAVDHVLHPDQYEEQDLYGLADEVKENIVDRPSVALRSHRKGSAKSKYEDHPKFAKFKQEKI